MTYTARSVFGCDPNCEGELWIGSSPGGFSLSTEGWMIYGLSTFWHQRTYRGTNRVVPRRQGQVGYPRRFDAHTFSLPFWVTGLLQPDGTPYTDTWYGYRANLDLLNAGAFDPVDTGDGGLACTLYLPDGVGGFTDTRTATVQFDGLERRGEVEDPSLVEFVVSGTILEGIFE